MTAARPARATWHIVTCEYPPQVGGVSDYVLILASALAAAGADTHVWCPRHAAEPTRATGVTTHAAFDGFGPGALVAVGTELNRFQGPRRIFVQWVPHGYGYRSLNVFFAIWLALRAHVRGDEIHLMIHEPFLPFAGSGWQHAGAAIHRIMLRLASSGAARVWLSIPRWADEIRPYVPRTVPVDTLPIPAPPIGTTTDGEALRIRTDYFPDGEPVVGHFGTFNGMVTALLAPALDEVLSHSVAGVLLIGRDSDTFRAAYVRTRPDSAARIKATGTLGADALAAHLGACDELVQPYPDGITGRRTSALALLRAGRPVVTNAGSLTEPLWHNNPAIALVDRPDGALVGRAAVALLQDAPRHASLRAAALDLYASRFAPRHAVAPLLTIP